MSKISGQNSVDPGGGLSSPQSAPPSSSAVPPSPGTFRLAGFPRLVSRAPLAFAALSAVAGISLAHWIEPPLPWLGLLLLPLLRPWPPPARPLAWLLFAAILSGALHRQGDLRAERLSLLLDAAPASGTPLWFSGTVETSLAEGGFRLHLTQIRRGSLSLATDNAVLLQVPSRLIRPGDRISGTGRLLALPSPRNPGEGRFSSPFSARLEVPSSRQLQREGVSYRFRAASFATRCREWIAQSITRGLAPDREAAGLIQAMVLGTTESASRETEEAFRHSGALHLFSVSGLHVAIFASIIWTLLRPFPVSRTQSVVIIACAIFFYAFITGLPPSAVRAALMLFVVLLGFALRREARLLNSLGLAALLILSCDTRELFDIGFQLSFAVVAAIALLCPVFDRRFRAWASPDPFLPRSLVSPARRRWERTGRYLTGLVSVSLAAWIGSLPLTLWYFGLLTPVSVLANCVLVPVSWLVMAGATLSLCLSLLHLPGLPVAVNLANAACADALRLFALFFAQLPGATVELPPLSGSWNRPAPLEDALVVLDLPQSCSTQAIVLPRPRNAPHPPLWLVDPGDGPGYRQVVRPWLRAQGIHQMERHLLTHGDSQHVDAAPTLLRDFSVRRVISSPLSSRSPVWNQLRREPVAPGQTRLELGAGSRLDLAPGLHLSVVFPPPDHPDQAAADDECLVLLLEWHGWRILSMADSGFSTEKWLLQHQPGLRCDVLLKSQHRDEPSALPEFLRLLRPSCLISSHSTYPPSEQIPVSLRDLLPSLGITLFDQSHTGAVTLTPTPDHLTITPFHSGKPLVLRRKRL